MLHKEALVRVTRNDDVHGDEPTTIRKVEVSFIEP
jgi:hypothetical protein